MALPPLPDFGSGKRYRLRDALKMIGAYLRAITPIAGGDVIPHMVAGGVTFSSLGGGAGQVPRPIKITTTVTGATCSTTGVTTFGAGAGKLILADGTLGEAITLKSHMPDEVEAPRHGWATIGPDGTYWLMEASCSTVPA